MNIGFLDRVLFYTKQVSAFKDAKRYTPELSEVEILGIERVYEKLEKDGYINFTVSVSGNRTSKRAKITFDGLVALEEPPLWWKNKPYKWKAFKDALNTWWNVGKVIVIFLNALFLLILAILTYLKS